MTCLLTKYRPATLAEVQGQPDVTRALRLFAKAPYPCAMLFHGESGIGKTCAARALARDLGCDPDQERVSGFYEVPSGELTADSVREAVRRLSYRPMFGSGWRVLVCNECDRMSTSAEVIWLDALERVPNQSVIAFTTNQPERLTQRFRDRCETYAFESDTLKLAPHIRRLARRIWAAEVGKGACPHLDVLGMPTLAGPDALHASFRLALQQLQQYIRVAKAGGGKKALGRVRNQLNRSVGLDMQGTSTCDHCGAEQDVPMGTRQHKCESCGKMFKIDWRPCA
jgi:replication-associated recombination protein RarA